MRIRSITSFFDPTKQHAHQDLEQLSKINQTLNEVITGSIMPVQSSRLATTPFPLFFNGKSKDQKIRETIQFEKEAGQLGWSYLSLGPALPENPESFQAIPDLLAATQNVFFSGIMADNKVIYPAAVNLCAEVIQRNAGISSDGFTNLRFAAIANVPPWTPFLPAAFHQFNQPLAISIAIECADVVLEAFEQSETLEEGRIRLLTLLEDAAGKISKVINKTLKGTGIVFKGFDFSPAPFPEDWCSLGGAIEQLGLNHIGGTGSLAAVAVIADTLDKGKWLHAGFNGMMLPVLEDSILAKRASEGRLSFKDLLLYSAVCGTGLDTIPLAGEITTGEIASILMDVAALSVRLGKPLTARLMPIPGKKAGDETSFNFGFFSNSRVMPIDGQSLTSFLSGDTPISLTPRHHTLS